MSKMPSTAAEKIYDVLIRYAEASPKYYDKEHFIYHFGVINKPELPNTFKLECIDSRPRTFLKEDGSFKLIGKGDNKVNAIIKSILKDYANV